VPLRFARPRRELRAREPGALGLPAVVAAFAVAAAGAAASFWLFSKEAPFLANFKLALALGASLLAAHAVLAPRTLRAVRELGALNFDLSVFASSLATSLRTGLSFERAVLEALPRLSSEHLKRALREAIFLTRSLELAEAIERVSRGLPRRASTVLRALVPVAESGGRAPDVAEVVHEYASRLALFDKSKASATKPYVYVVMLAVAVFEAGTLLMLRIASGFYGPGSLAQPLMPLSEIWGYSYYANLLIAALSAMFVAKVSRGSIKYYADYFVALCALHLVFMGVLPQYFVF